MSCFVGFILGFITCFITITVISCIMIEDRWEDNYD